MKKTVSDSGYDDRYGSEWTRVAIKTKESTGGLCCFPGCDRLAIVAHHAVYRDRKGDIPGREDEELLIGTVLFPLCRRHHGRKHDDAAHYWRNWRKAREPAPGLDARQLPHYYKLLREGWCEKTKNNA